MQNNSSTKHYSVLLNESIDALNIKPDGIYVDLTLGMGGHSEAILKKLTTGKLYCFDKDLFAIENAKKRLSKVSDNYVIFKSDFSEFYKILKQNNINKVDGIIADLGISSPQIDNVDRGFSYINDAELDMRMDREQEISAKTIINTYSANDLQHILSKYGEVKNAKQLAHAIVDNRPINTTLELVNVIKSNTPQKLLKLKNPAKAVFQAIRIEVNNELGSLEKMLEESLLALNRNGKLVIITFHSLEDKIVKYFFKKLIANKMPSKIPVMENKEYEAKQINPSADEILENSRSKSAKLRVLTKLI